MRYAKLKDTKLAYKIKTFRLKFVKLKLAIEQLLKILVLLQETLKSQNNLHGAWRQQCIYYSGYINLHTKIIKYIVHIFFSHVLIQQCVLKLKSHRDDGCEGFNSNYIINDTKLLNIHLAKLFSYMLIDG